MHPSLRQRDVPRHDAVGRTHTDLLAARDRLEVYVEVKAPYVERPSQGHWFGDDSRALVQCVRDAARQCKTGRANLVLLFPSLRNEIYEDRSQLLSATVGEIVWVVPVAMDRDSPPSSGHIDFRQNGRLARVQPNGDTQHTRISAVMSVEPRWRYLDNDSFELRYSVVVVHNPFAAVRIDPAFFGDVPQWVRTGDTMAWNDDYRGP